MGLDWPWLNLEAARLVAPATASGIVRARYSRSRLCARGAQVDRWVSLSRGAGLARHDAIVREGSGAGGSGVFRIDAGYQCNISVIYSMHRLIYSRVAPRPAPARHWVRPPPRRCRASPALPCR